MKTHLTLVVIFLTLMKYCESIDCSVTAKSTEENLRQNLLCDYQNTVRPTAEFHNATVIWVSMIIKSFTYDDTSHTLFVNSKTFLNWEDQRLAWNRSEYNNLSSIVVRADTIWTPDFTIYNSKSTQFEQSCHIGNCRISSSGWVLCIPQCLYEGDCQPDYTHWPFDSQNCTMRFGAWIDYGEEVNFRPQYNAVKDSYSHQKEWKLMSLTSKRLPGNLPCCSNETFPSLHYSFILQRHSASERAFVFAPAISIKNFARNFVLYYFLFTTVFATVNVLTLLLDPNSIERILLSVLAIFAHFMFIQQLSWLIPKNGDTVPSFLIYARDSLIISTFLLLDTIFMRSLMSCNAVSPAWIKSLTVKIKNHRLGQSLLSKSYLLNKTTFITPKEDIENLVQAENAETKQFNEEARTWTMVVKFLDRALFVLLLLVYLTMMLAWVPASYEKYEGNTKVKTIHER